MSRVLLLPGSRWQLPLAKKIKEMGHWLCVVSPEDAPPCAALADDFFQSDIFAVDSIEMHARRIGIEAIVSDECDIAMPVIAELGKRMNAKTLSSEAAMLFTDKHLMREFCIRHGFKTPEYRLCRSVDEAVEFFRNLGKPVVIKPLDSNASHGVFRIDSEQELRTHFEETISFSRIEKAVLAERYIVGTEFTVDGVKTPGKHFSLAISEKKHFAHNENIANELYFSHSNPCFDYEKLKEVNNAFVMASPLKFGFTHAEYKYEDGDFFLIEIGARGGGNMISSVITQFMSGYDTYRYLIECATGNVTDEEFAIPDGLLSRASVLKFLQTPYGGGKVKRIEGLSCLDNEPDIVEYQLNFSVGDTIEDAKNDSARIGFYIACSEDSAKLDKVREMVERELRIYVE